MLHLALQQLRSDLGRSVLTSAGIAAVFAVILVLRGFREGLDSQLRRVAPERGAHLVALIRLDEGASRDVVRTAIEEAVAEVDVFTPEELARSDEELGETMLGTVLTVLIGVAYAAGLLVVGLFMFVTAEGRRRDLGILEAIGFSNGAILASVVGEAALLTVLAMPVGVLLAIGVAAGVGALMPVYLILPTVPVPLIRAVVAAAAFALLGALGPFALVRRLDPAEVFRS